MNTPFYPTDCKLTSVNYVNGFAIVEVIDADGKTWEIKVKSQTLYIAALDWTQKHQFNGVSLTIHNLKESLKIENGLFLPPNKVSELTYDVNKGLSLAYGHPTSAYELVITIFNSRRIASFLVAREEDIHFKT